MFIHVHLHVAADRACKCMCERFVRNRLAITFRRKLLGTQRFRSISLLSKCRIVSIWQYRVLKMTFYSLKPFMWHYFISSCFYGTSNKAALNSFKWIQCLLNHVHCIAYNFIQKAKEPIPNLIEIHNSSLRVFLMNKQLYKINDVFELINSPMETNSLKCKTS